MRRGVVILVAAVAAIGILAGGLGWLLTDARPLGGASRAQRLYYAYCAECHRVDGRGSWRAAPCAARPRETRVSGTASAPAVNRCPLTGAPQCRFAWSNGAAPRAAGPTPTPPTTTVTALAPPTRA